MPNAFASFDLATMHSSLFERTTMGFPSSLIKTLSQDA